MPNDETPGSFSTPLVVVIGEGSSDVQYLEPPLKAYYSKKYGVKCKLITISDVTSDPNYTDEQLMDLLPGFIEGELKRPINKIDKEIAKNIKEIIQIIDIDEAFIDDSLIKEDKSKKDFFYTRSGIEYKDIKVVIERNKRKKNRIAMLRNMRTVNVFDYNIPYSFLFFSINIDDFHYPNALNWSQEEKNKQAALFARTNYYGKSDDEKIEAFKLLFDKNNPIDFPNSIDEAWDYVSRDNNCLKTCSNVIYKIKD